MATNPNFPEGNRPAPDAEERTSDEFDPNRFGKFKLNTNFFKWAISTPLPKEREEDLWHDTIPPGGVEGKSPASLPDGPTAELKDSRPGVPPRVLDLTPEEAEVLKKGKLRRTGVVVVGLLVVLCVVAYFATGTDEQEADQVAPAVNTTNETVKDSKPIAQEAEATTENPENKIEHKVDAPKDLPPKKVHKATSPNTAAPKPSRGDDTKDTTPPPRPASNSANQDQKSSPSISPGTQKKPSYFEMQ